MYINSCIVGQRLDNITSQVHIISFQSHLRKSNTITLCVGTMLIIVLFADLAVLSWV